MSMRTGQMLQLKHLGIQFFDWGFLGETARPDFVKRTAAD